MVLKKLDIHMQNNEDGPLPYTIKKLPQNIKLSLYAGDMTLDAENPKDSTQKLLELINEFSKVAG